MRLHFFGGEHVDIVKIKWFKYMLLHIVVKRRARYTLESYSCPVDIGLSISQKSAQSYVVNIMYSHHTPNVSLAD